VDERFSIEPHYRQAARGGSGPVRDGYLVADSVAGARRRVDRQVDAKQTIARALDREAALDWEQIASWGAQTTRRTSSGVLEVYGYDADGKSVGQLTLVGSALDPSETVANIRRWLAYVGHPDLPERTL
jgi:hypothetical protein